MQVYRGFFVSGSPGFSKIMLKGFPGEIRDFGRGWDKWFIEMEKSGGWSFLFDIEYRREKGKAKYIYMNKVCSGV